MKNADMPAMPATLATGEVFEGLTKREKIAIHMMASLIQNGAINEIGNEDWYAKRACQLSDFLLEELDK